MSTFNKNETDLELGDGGLDVVRKVMALPHHPPGSTPEHQLELMHEELELMHEELALRDFLAAWAYTFDARDLDGLMEFFADDCTLVNGRGRFVGPEAIRTNYELFYERWATLRHSWGNVSVRFPDRLDRAFVTAYHWGLNATTDGTRHVGHVGTDIWDMAKIDHRWKAVGRYLSFDIDHDLQGWNETPVT